MGSSRPDNSSQMAQIQANRLYQELSNELGGSTEYMAMEKLYELSQEGRYDLLVLDTPPTRNALDFLEKPAAEGIFKGGAISLPMVPHDRTYTRKEWEAARFIATEFRRTVSNTLRRATSTRTV